MKAEKMSNKKKNTSVLILGTKDWRILQRTPSTLSTRLGILAPYSVLAFPICFPFFSPPSFALSLPLPLLLPLTSVPCEASVMSATLFAISPALYD